MPDETRDIIPQDVTDDDLKKICERVIQQLTKSEEDLVESNKKKCLQRIKILDMSN